MLLLSKIYAENILEHSPRYPLLPFQISPKSYTLFPQPTPKQNPTPFPVFHSLFPQPKIQSPNHSKLHLRIRLQKSKYNLPKK